MLTSRQQERLEKPEEDYWNKNESEKQIFTYLNQKK